MDELEPREVRRAVRDVAEETLGFDRLRAGQEEAIRAVMEGHDTLAIMPTGSGKSAIYQIAATLMPGPTVVVSPLIALQRDQVEAIETAAAESEDEDVERPIGRAAAANSTVPEAEQSAAFEALRQGSIEFLFLAPEQFDDPQTLDRLRGSRLSLFVVDEAHCISQWGHDFRPSYLKLGAVLDELGHPPTLALTATAAPPVREEILERLRMHDPRVIVRGFDRPNIWLGAEQYPDEIRKQRALLEWVVGTDKPGIVYAATRRRAEDLAAALAERGVSARAYHAGLAAGQRARVQEAFMAGEVEVMVATTAFGMGVDKADVRFVAHADVADSLDAYYQEIGRAGRDGEPARAMLFYRPEDLGIRRFFAASGRVDVEHLDDVVRAVRRHRSPVSRAELKRETGLSQARLTTAISRLEEVGGIVVGPTGDVSQGSWQGSQVELANYAARLEDRRRQYERSRIEMMRGYAEVRDCRRGYLLNYFGEPYAHSCGNCDNCDQGIVVEEGEQPFPLNARVVHPRWGEGLVLRYEGNTIEILFDSVGYKTLALQHVLDEGLLTPVS